MLITRKSITLLLFILFLTLTVGCKSSDSPTESTSPLVGTWKLTKILAPGLTLTPEQAKDIFGISIALTIIAKADATYEATVIKDGVTTVDKGTWSSTSTQFTLKSTDGTTTLHDYSRTGNILTIKGWSMEIPNFGTVVADFEMTKQ